MMPITNKQFRTIKKTWPETLEQGMQYLPSLFCTLCVFVINFEHVIAGWDGIFQKFKEGFWRQCLRNMVYEMSTKHYWQVFLVTNLKALISGLIISKIWYSHSKHETVDPKPLFDI